jgi:hypothetical protein
MDLESKLKKIREQANNAPTVYQKTRLDYAYMETVMKEAPDLYDYRHEIRTFQQLCLLYKTVYDEAIYGHFLELLQKMIDKMD